MCHVTPRVSVYFFLIFGLQHCFYFYLPHFFFLHLILRSSAEKYHTFFIEPRIFFVETFLFFDVYQLKKPPPREKKTHIYRTFTARAHTCGRVVDLPHVRLCRAASLLPGPRVPSHPRPCQLSVRPTDVPSDPVIYVTYFYVKLMDRGRFSHTRVKRLTDQVNVFDFDKVCPDNLNNSTVL